MSFRTLFLVLELHNELFTNDIRVEGTASELKVLHFKHGQLEVVLSRTRDVIIDVVFVPTIHGTNLVNKVVVKFDKIALILELLNVYHADSAIFFNS